MQLGKLYLFVITLGMLCAPIAGATNFAILLGGEGGSGKTELHEIESVEIEDLVLDEISRATRKDVPRDVWRAAKRQGYRVTGPGDAHYGSITIRARVGSVGEGQLNEWWKETARGGDQGQDIRKDMSVIALKRSGAPVLTYEFLDAFPVRWDPGEYSPVSNEQPLSSMTVEYQAIDFVHADNGNSNCDSARQGGFRITTNAGSGEDTDTMWETCSGGRWFGGEPGLLLQYPFRESQFHQTMPGHKCVSPITVGGTVASATPALHGWIKETVQGGPWKKSFVVTENSGQGADGAEYQYLDCFPTRYVFPAFSASSTGNLYVEITVQATRYVFPALSASGTGN